MLSTPKAICGWWSMNSKTQLFGVSSSNLASLIVSLRSEQKYDPDSRQVEHQRFALSVDADKVGGCDTLYRGTIAIR